MSKMFRLESYVTPLIIGHVEKYVSNLRADKARVSLWGGDAVFSDLDLRLDVLEHELQLPLSIVSGHIHELIIHVPWTRLHAEPVLVTINTIECVLALPKTTSTGTTTSARSTTSAPKSTSVASETRESTPPGYIQSLLNKVVANISVVCNNLILKYMEDDIVLSLNTRHLRLTSANRWWQEAFIDLTPPELILRKVLNVSDLTVCLDRREASGKIESYLEPVLYKCSFLLHAARCYESVHSKNPTLTRVDVHCPSLEFSLNDTQVPMFLRIAKLALGLYHGEIGPSIQSAENETNVDNDGSNDNVKSRSNTHVDDEGEKSDSEDHQSAGGDEEGGESWSSLMWSVGSALGSSLVPVYWSSDDDDDDDDDDRAKKQKVKVDRVMHVGVYVDKASVLLKLTRHEKVSKKSMFGLSKQLFIPFTKMDLQGIVMEAVARGVAVLNCSAGISHLQISAVNEEHFGNEFPERGPQQGKAPYLSLGKPGQEAYLRGSLFDNQSDGDDSKASTEESIPKERIRDYSQLEWEKHLESSNEETMLSRCPALMCDYLFQIDCGSNEDHAADDVLERSLARCIIGPLRLLIDSGLIQRAQFLKLLSEQYDYPPYPSPKVVGKALKTNTARLAGADKMTSSGPEESSTSCRSLSSRCYRLTLINASVHLYLSDLPPTLISLEMKRFPTSTVITDQLPGLALKVACVDIETTKPMYPSEVKDSVPEMLTLLQVVKVSSLLFVGNQNVTLMQPIDASLVHRVTLENQNDTDKQDEDTSLKVDNIFNLPQLRLRLTRPQLEAVMVIVRSHIEETWMASRMLEDIFTRNLDALVVTLVELKCRLATTSRDARIAEFSLMKSSAHLAMVGKDEGRVPLFDDVDQLVKRSASKLSSTSSTLSSPGRAHSRCKESSLRVRDLSPNREPLLYILVQIPKHVPTSTNTVPVVFCCLNTIFVNIDAHFVKWMVLHNDGNELRSPAFARSVRNRESRETSTFSERMSLSNTRETTSVRSILSTSIRSNEKKNLDADVTNGNGKVAFMERLRNLFQLVNHSVVQLRLSSVNFLLADASLMDCAEPTVLQMLTKAKRKASTSIVCITTPTIHVDSVNMKTDVTQMLHNLPVALSTNEKKSSYGLPWTVTASKASLEVFVPEQGCKNSTVYSCDQFSCTVDISRDNSNTGDKESNSNMDINSTTKIALCFHSDMKASEARLSDQQLKAMLTIIEQMTSLTSKPKSGPTETNVSTNKETTSRLSSIRSADFVHSSPSLFTKPIEDELNNEEEGKARDTDSELAFEVGKSDVDCERVGDSVWMQCTSPGFHLTLVVDDKAIEVSLEDLQWSLDWNDVYLKTKMKIAVSTIYMMNANERQLIFSSISDVVDDVMLSQHSMVVTASGPSSVANESFLSLSWLRRCGVGKLRESKCTELHINMSRIDALVDLPALQPFIKHFLSTLLHSITSIRSTIRSSTPSHSESTTDLTVTHWIMPMLHLGQSGLRLFVRASPCSSTSSQGHVLGPDTLMVFMEGVETKSAVPNPLARLVLQSQVFGQVNAARSNFDDHQYSTRVKGLGLYSGQWRLLRRSGSAKKEASLMTTGENPAYEWNTMTHTAQTTSKGDILRETKMSEQSLQPLVSAFDMEFTVAPPIVNETTLIAALSIELNVLNDVDIYLSRHQLRLWSNLHEELEVIKSLVVNGDESPKKMSVSDSGVECSQSALLSRRRAARTNASRGVPTEALVTLCNLTCHIFEIDNWNEIGHEVFERGKIDSVGESNPDDSHYDASESSLSTTLSSSCPSLKMTPWCCLHVAQPHLLSRSWTSDARKELVIFNASLLVNDNNDSKYGTHGDHLPKLNDCASRIIESRTGDLDPRTGVQPNLIKVVEHETGQMKVQVGRPVQVRLDPEPIERLVELFENIRSELGQRGDERGENEVRENHHALNHIFGMSWKSIQLETMQMVLCSSIEIVCSRSKDMSDKEKTMQEVGLTAGLVSLSLSIMKKVSMGREHSLLVKTAAKNVVVKTHLDSCVDRLVNVIKVDSKVRLSSRSSESGDFNILAKVASSPIKVKVGCNHIVCLRSLVPELCRRFRTSSFATNSSSGVSELKTTGVLEKEKTSSAVFVDDLRAGAFKFVVKEGNKESDKCSECKPYQVVFSSNAMTWSYPSPRALVRLSVSPVPIHTNLEKSSTKKRCRLEFWDELEESFQYYGDLYVSEQSHCHLNLPTLGDKRRCAVAATWRIVAHGGDSQSSNDDDDDDDVAHADIDVRTLGSAVQVDSCQDASLVPSVRLSLNLACVDLTLVNHLQSVVTTLPESYSHFYLCPGQFPMEQSAMTVKLTMIQSIVESWQSCTTMLRLKTGLFMNVDEWQFLSSQPFLVIPKIQIQSRLELDHVLRRNLDTFLQMDELSFHYGHFAHRTLNSTLRLWQSQLAAFNDDCLFSPPVFSHYLLANDTQLSLWFGQESTSENILLRPRQCFMYAWRSQQAPLRMRAKFDPLPASEEPKWSKPFSIDSEDNVESLRYIEDPLVGLRPVVITCKKVEGHRIITISGLLNVVSLLRDALEVRLANDTDRKEENSSSSNSMERWLLPGMSSSPSTLISSNDQTLKIRLHGIGTQWSGHIRLHNKKNSRSVLVRIPTKDRRQVLTVWCRIIQKWVKSRANEGKEEKVVRTVVILSPMYVARSSLPHPLTMLYAADDNEDVGHTRRRATLLPGEDVVTQLDTFCMSDKKYNVAFRVSDVASEAIEMHYKLMEKHDNVVNLDGDDSKINMDDILMELGALMRGETEGKMWPYVDVMNTREEKEWKREQPQTEIDVAYVPLCKWTNTLCVEVKPWCLIVNDLTEDIALKLGLDAFFVLKAGTTFVPPKFDVSFRLGLCLDKDDPETVSCVVRDGKKFAFSDLLQLSEKSDWPFRKQTMPTFQGQLMKEGYAHTKIVMNSNTVGFITVHSKMKGSIRVLHIRATFALLNRSQADFGLCPSVTALSCNDISNQLTLSSDSSTAILFWSHSRKCEENNEDIVDMNEFEQNLVFFDASSSETTKCSKNLKFDDLRREFDEELLIRKPMSVPKSRVTTNDELCDMPIVISAHNVEGQVYFVVHDDSNPRLIVHNNSDVDVTLVKGDASSDCLYSVSARSSSSVPIEVETSPTSQEELPLVLSIGLKDIQKLSESVDCSVDQERFVTFRSEEDDNKMTVKVIVRRLACTTHITIKAVIGLQEVSAGSIRNRLLNSQDNHIESNEEEQNYAKPKDQDSSWKSSLQCVFQLHVQEMFLALMDDCVTSIEERVEILRLTVDNLLVDVRPLVYSDTSRCVQMSLSLADLQVDNSLFDREAFDFRTILFNSNPGGKMTLSTLTLGMSDHALNKAVEQSLASMRVVMESNLRVSRVSIDIKPLTANVEDRLVNRLKETLQTFDGYPSPTSSSTSLVPHSVILASQMIASQLTLEELHVAPLHLSLSVHTSLKVYLGVDNSPLVFAPFNRNRLLTTTFGLGQTLALHYISGALFRAGVMVASIDLIGSPALLTRSISTGLVDFVVKPIEGLLNGPWAFIEGLTFGSRSLIAHLGGGTLSSVTNMADSLSRNLDKLSLDTDHCARNALIRSHHKPRRLTEGLVNGMSSIGLSLLGAIGGIAHHPLAVFMDEDNTEGSVLGGVARGLVGVVTKPLGGAAELMSQTGQGILAGVGWRQEVEPRCKHDTSMRVKAFYEGSGGNRIRAKIVNTNETVVNIMEASMMRDSATTSFTAVLLVLTEDHLMVVHMGESLDLLHVFPVSNETELRLRNRDTCDDGIMAVVLIHDVGGGGGRRHLKLEHVSRFVYGQIPEDLDRVSSMDSSLEMENNEEAVSQVSTDQMEKKRREGRKKGVRTRLLFEMSRDAAFELITNFELATRQTHNKGFLLM